MTQIKEFLRRGLFTVIVLCSAAACSNNDENEDTNYTLDGIQWAMLNDDKVEETVINIMPEIYDCFFYFIIIKHSPLYAIQWAMLNDDKVEETVINIMPEIYENASSSTISVTIDPAMDYEQLSQFYYDDSNFFQPLNQTPNEVNVLTGELVFNDFRYVSEGPVVPFTLEEYAYPPDNHIEETLTIPPYHTLYYNATVIKREVTATYRAYFIGNNSNERIEITGKWKGTFYRNDKSLIRLEKME